MRLLVRHGINGKEELAIQVAGNQKRASQTARTQDTRTKPKKRRQPTTNSEQQQQKKGAPQHHEKKTTHVAGSVAQTSMFEANPCVSQADCHSATTASVV